MSLLATPALWTALALLTFGIWLYFLTAPARTHHEAERDINRALVALFTLALCTANLVQTSRRRNDERPGEEDHSSARPSATYDGQTSASHRPR